MHLFGGRKQEAALADRDQRLQVLEAECRSLQSRLEGTQELVRHLDQDRDLLLGALEYMRPGKETLSMAQVMQDVCFKPLGLACFYVAVADWEVDQLRFILYHEGGKTRNHPPRRLSDGSGLSAKVLASRQPIYIRTIEEGQAAGALLTAAEQATGLIPHTWFGVPLGWGPRPAGLVSFQSFQTDAFSEPRRRVMQALAALLSTCMAR